MLYQFVNGLGSDIEAVYNMCREVGGNGVAMNCNQLSAEVTENISGKPLQATFLEMVYLHEY
jgi:hypothetical protein